MVVAHKLYDVSIELRLIFPSLKRKLCRHGMLITVPDGIVKDERRSELRAV